MVEATTNIPANLLFDYYNFLLEVPISGLYYGFMPSSIFSDKSTYKAR